MNWLNRGFKKGKEAVLNIVRFSFRFEWLTRAAEYGQTAAFRRECVMRDKVGTENR